MKLSLLIIVFLSLCSIYFFYKQINNSVTQDHMSTTISGLSNDNDILIRISEQKLLGLDRKEIENILNKIKAPFFIKEINNEDFLIVSGTIEFFFRNNKLTKIKNNHLLSE